MRKASTYVTGMEEIKRAKEEIQSERWRRQRQGVHPIAQGKLGACVNQDLTLPFEGSLGHLWGGHTGRGGMGR